jgi:hypothetical protein
MYQTTASTFSGATKHGSRDRQHNSGDKQNYSVSESIIQRNNMGRNYSARFSC